LAAPPLGDGPACLRVPRGVGAGVRALDRDAAVGLLSRSATPLERVAFLAGVGTGGWALRAFARDAAVGANSPDDGVLDLTGAGEVAGCWGVGVWV
jgi:hypothetical protein